MAARHKNIHAEVADVTDQKSIAQLYDRGPFDIVVANAGGAESAPAEKISAELWTKTLNVNLTGAFFSVQPALTGMRAKKWGRIVFIASTAGIRAAPYIAPYVAAKHGVIGLMRTLALETAKDGITVNAVCPSYTETPMLEQAVARIVATTKRSEAEARAHARGQESARPFHHNPGSRRHGAVAVHRRGRQHHRPGHLAVGRRDMVSAPLPAIAEPKESDSKSRLRLWIRLLRASRLIESVARERLKAQFNATLPRFDVMAALYRKPDGMLMSEISRFLMVSNGNVTGIVDRLVSDGLVARAQRNGDRRTSFISLTRKGRTLFADMAAAHESWVDELLGGLSVRDAEQMSAKLKSFRSDWEGEA